jgi:hypothetical protein
MTKVFVASVALVCLCMAASAQPSRRNENRDRLMSIMATNAEDPSALTRKTREFLASLDREESFEAEPDVLRWARSNSVLTRLEYSREMLALNLHYAPDDDVATAYWRHSIMISAKLERGEIGKEEFDYLEARKLAEARRASSEQRTADAQPSTPAAPPVEDRNAVGSVLIGIGNALRSRPATTTTSCVRVGAAVQCTTR